MLVENAKKVIERRYKHCLKQAYQQVEKSDSMLKS